MSDLSITIIQTNLFWENKKANLEMLEEKIKNISIPTQIVVLPEMFSTGFSMNAPLLAEKMEGITIEWMKRISRENKIIIAGSIIIKEEDKYYNRLIWMMPNGQFGQYDKRHLFGLANETNIYTAGNKRLITSVNGWKINLQICYDLRFPVWSRQQSVIENNILTPEFDLLIYVANWPEKRNNAWETLLSARAIENQCYVVGVNRIGIDNDNNNHIGNSCVINPLGEVLYKKYNEEDIFTISLQKDKLLGIRESFPFLKDADIFNIQQDLI